MYEGWCWLVIYCTCWWYMRVQSVPCTWGASCWLYQALWSCCFASFYCRLDLCCGECYFGCLQCVCFLIYVSVVLCVLCLNVLVICLFNVFAICVGEVNIFYLKVMVFFFLGYAVFCCLIRVCSSKEYVCCVYDHSVCLGVPSVCLICVFVWEMWFQKSALRSRDHLRFVLWCCFCVIICVLCVLEIDWMWSLSCLLWWSFCDELCPLCIPIIRECVSVLL